MLVCRADLMPLFATIPGIAEVREPGTLQVAEFDTYLPLLSLPEVFGTTLETIPDRVPYFDLATLRRRQGGRVPILPGSGHMKIGIVWVGSSTYQNDRHRSCRLSAFMPMLGIPGIDFFSLQKGEPSQELTELTPGLAVHDLDAAIRDFGDTALFIEQLDLVISVDTAVAHLAGALGKPVWLLLPAVPDWRWGLQGDTTPWYPSMRLFRQTQRGDWTEIMARVAAALSAR